MIFMGNDGETYATFSEAHKADMRHAILARLELEYGTAGNLDFFEVVEFLKDNRGIVEAYLESLKT